MENSKERIVTLDIVRIVAAVAVVMIHSCSRFIMLYGNDTTEFIYGNFFNCISRPGVPLFVMISGALMLDENKEIT